MWPDLHLKYVLGSGELLKPAEDIALQKLALSFKTEASKENSEVSVEFTPCIPNNNPFKRRKIDEMLVDRDAVAVDDDLPSEVMVIEKSDILCKSQESVNSTHVNIFSNIRRKSVKLSTQGSNSLAPKRSSSTSILNFFSPL